MATPGIHTARLLLDRIPKHDRPQVVRSIVGSLGQTSEIADVEFAATLLHLQPESTAKELLLGHLDRLIRQGEQDEVLSICFGHDELKGPLIQHALSTLANTQYNLAEQPKESLAVPYETEPRVEAVSGFVGTAQIVPSIVDEAIHCLEFVCRAVSPQTESNVLRFLFQKSMFFVGAADQMLVKGAQRLLISLLPLQRLVGEDYHNALWTRIQSLISSNDSFYETVGFSIWLRCLLVDQERAVAIIQQPNYWSSVVNGLRQGDSERRKAAIQVLRVSIEASVRKPSLLSTITTASQIDLVSPDAVQKQYSRFCTVFETIILGRYLNQIQECEADLDFLASTESLVRPVWLYALLSSALDQEMQESNRKFIGNWIMRSRPRIDDAEAYLEFLRNSFLPWAAGGSLFTSTLRNRSRSLRCEHGERLAAYVRDLMQCHTNVASRIVETVLDTLLARYGNNFAFFAYFMVYLVDGIGQAFDTTPQLQAEPSHIDKIRRIAGWTGYPEVARDCILARLWKMCHVAESGTGTQLMLWERLREKSQTMTSGASAHVDGNIASLAMVPSKRDQHERAAIQKCIAFANQMDQEDTAVDITKYKDVIDDIWSDLDYLEYPKSLLVVIPTIIPHPRLIQAAPNDSADVNSLAEVLASKTNDLLELSESRSYFLAPLVSAFRGMAIKGTGASAVVQLEDVIMHVAKHPPKPTVDVRLEDAALPLLRSLGPGMENFSYEYYFGNRKGHGFAALLDLVSRLHNIDMNITRRIFSSLLEQWRTQKTPPPTVSTWKTTLQLQVMLLCCEQHMMNVHVSETSTILKDLHYILAIEPLPRYRYLLEWMIARVYIRYPVLREGLLEELGTKDHHSNPKFLASLMKLGVMLAKTAGCDEAFALQLATVFIPLAASSKVIIRHESQWQIPILMDLAKAQGWDSISKDTGLVALDDFIRSLERFGDPPLERQIDRLDPVTDHNLTHLVEGPWYELDHIEQRQTCREDFIKLYELEEETVNSKPLPASCMPLGDPISPPASTSETPINHDRKILQNIDNISRALGSGPGPAALQTKGAAYLESTQKRHDNLLVVASLVDNPYNLGGLSRVSEIFGAGAMFLQNPTVTSNKDFTNVSVSSHLHFPILPLAAGDIMGFLAKKKAEEGFSVVGIEQTDRSVMLGSDACALPEKCIVVIGSEREGIPALVLGECDLLIEIPQLGITRSLNVQTAAGIVLCEYAKQRKMLEK